jgi:hypothetical protein
MPATENDRRNMQEIVLEKPSMPDHDRTTDEGMHVAIPREMMENDETRVGNVQEGESLKGGSMDDDALAAPDQEFGQMIESGTRSNNGHIPEDPNNWLTSDAEQGYSDGDPENRGESLADVLENDKH